MPILLGVYGRAGKPACEPCEIPSTDTGVGADTIVRIRHSLDRSFPFTIIQQAGMEDELPLTAHLCVSLARPAFPPKIITVSIPPERIHINHSKCSVPLLRDNDFLRVPTIVN